LNEHCNVGCDFAKVVAGAEREAERSCAAEGELFGHSLAGVVVEGTERSPRRAPQDSQGLTDRGEGQARLELGRRGRKEARPDKRFLLHADSKLGGLASSLLRDALGKPAHIPVVRR
jgi:hypothetical protein